MTQKYEIGSQWETRRGTHATVNEIDAEEMTMAVWHDGEGSRTHRLDGSNVNGRKEYDLLRPWVEKRSGWVNVYEDENGRIIAETKGTDFARYAALSLKPIACVKWTEGDGV